MSTNSENIYYTDHSVLADPKDTPWLAHLNGNLESSNLPSKENVEHATEESDGRSQWFDDGCGKKLYWENVPVYAVHGQEGLGDGGSNFELTWENEDAKNDCAAPAEKSELFINMGAAHEDNLGDRNTTSWLYWSRALQQNQAYYMAVPNEKYLLLIQHFIYKFPYFLRDENGLPVPEVEEESKKSSEYTDIRSIPFEDLTWNPGTNRGADAIHPYVPGCACAIDGDHTDITSASSVASSGWSISSTSGPWGADQSHSAFTQASTTGSGTGALFSVTTDGAGIPTFTWVSGGSGYAVGDTLTFNDPYLSGESCVLYVNGLLGEAKPYADINLAYTNAIVPGSEKTMKYTVTHEDLAQMSYCTCNDTKNYVYNFEGIKPETRFGTEEFFTSILQKQGVDLSDYITEGQYAVFYVGFSPERHGDAADCHDQVGFRYAFAFNLKDRPSKLYPSPCQADPCFVAKHDDVHAYGRSCPGFSESREDFDYNTAPKLYDVPQEIINKYFVKHFPNGGFKSFMEVQYPGKIYMQYDTQGNDVKDKNVTDCLYLAGRKIDPCKYYRGEGKANLTYHFKPEQPMQGIKTSTDKVYIENDQNYGGKWEFITTPYYTQEEVLAENLLTTDATYGLSTVTQILAQSNCSKYTEVISHQYAGKDSEDSDNCEDGSCYEYNVHLNLNFDVHTKIAINNTSVFGTYLDGREHLE